MIGLRSFNLLSESEESMMFAETSEFGPRMSFQRYWGRRVSDSILNIGACDDPVGLGVKVYPSGLNKKIVQFDLDRWPGLGRVQGDAHALPFADRSFEMVIVGDVHEHLYQPLTATLEAARVADRWLVMTIFEEWRLPSKGQWIELGIENGQRDTRRSGYPSYEFYMKCEFPTVELVPDEKYPHHFHINAFSDTDIAQLIEGACATGLECSYHAKIPETSYAGHQWSNWLIVLERKNL